MKRIGGMLVLRNGLLPLPGFAAMNLFGLLLARRGTRLDEVLVRHEAIHSRQMRETGYVGFYVWYVAEWLLRLAARLATLPRVDKGGRRHHLHGAYANLLFEREAYAHAGEADYLERRTRYAWFSERRPCGLR